MKFTGTSIEGVYLIEPDKHEDNRGYFSRTFDKNEFSHRGINYNIVQTSLSFNKEKGTVRGMHYQSVPYYEEKIVQCVKGSIYDVVLDLRSYSKSYGKWQSFILTCKNSLILYIPIEIAHGFQTLEDDSIVLYYMDMEYHPECAKTIKYNDKRYNILWELPATNISYKDKGS